jgi:hypothetical protein
MKVVLMNLVTVMMSVPALAASADLVKLSLQPGGYLEKARVSSGKIEVNRKSRTITLIAQPDFYCPPGKFCAQVMPAPIEITVPLNSVKTGGCGETIFSGSKDLRPVDGGLSQLTVVSNARNFCKYLVAIPATTVNYHYEGGMMPILEDDQFIGTSLK